MPGWLYLTVVGVALAVAGFAGLGNILLWVGVGILLTGLALSLLSWRRARHDPPSLAPPDGAGSGPGKRRRQLTWQRRAARLGWVAAALGLLSVVLLGSGIWIMATGQPRIVPGDPQQAAEVVLPVNVQIQGPRLVVVLSLGLAVSGVMVGMAALQAAAAMQVLSRGRRVAEPLPGRAAAMGRRVLGPAAMSALELERPPGWPVSALPERSGAAATVPHCTVLIPAHDEEAVLGLTLASLARQTRPPDRVLVVADNCTDGTVRIAREHGVDVVETVDNTQYKAGALNQVLARLLAEGRGEAVYLVMDADSTITPDFLAVALRTLQDEPDQMAVGGLFSGDDGAGVLGQMQRNEFTRYQRVIRRREGQLFVLTGTASLFRGYALRAVAESRGTLIPGVPGGVYDTLAMTEDNEITLALKSLGAQMTSPPECRVTTEVMPSWRTLWRQRSRWQGGAVENIAAYGLTRTTLRYWAQQLSLGYGVIALQSYLLVMTVGLLAADHVQLSPFWLTVGSTFIIERVVTAWDTGWRGRAVAVTLIPELAYSLYLQACFLMALLRIATGREAGWNFVPRPPTSSTVVVPLVAAPLIIGWNPLPASVLQSAWFQDLTLFVGVNTLFFAVRALFEVLPPIRRSIHRLQRRGSNRPVRHAAA